jgi:hypothetical protein
MLWLLYLLFILAVLVLGRVDLHAIRGTPSEPVSRESRVLVVLATAAAIIPAAALLFLPIYMSSSGPRTLIEVNGPAAGLLALLPALVAAGPLVARRASAQALMAATCGFLLAVFSLVGGMSIGAFFIPSASLLLLAAATSLRKPRTV